MQGYKYWRNPSGSNVFILASLLSSGIDFLKNHNFQDRNGVVKLRLMEGKVIISGNTNTEKTEVLQFKHIGLITQQAFTDLGFSGPVLIKLLRGESNTSVFTFPHKNERGAVVFFDYPDILNRTDDEIYALAAHEAVHCLHRHELIKKSVGQGLFVGSSAYTFVLAFKYCSNLSYGLTFF